MILTKRQGFILNFIANNPGSQTQDIRSYVVAKNKEDISRITVIRDIEELLKDGYLQKEGAGRSIAYKLTEIGKLLAPIDPVEYFNLPPDERTGEIGFQGGVFKNLKYIFSEIELFELSKINEEYQKGIREISPAILRKEFERLTIELSWKSSQIEGNTYSLIDTEILLTQQKEAEGHKKEEAIMLINHKNALEYVYQNAKKFKEITLRDIEDVHAILVKDLNVEVGLRKKIVGITGSSYRPLDNQFQIREAMEELVKTVNELANPLEKALAFILLLSYVQPFEDGNKRTARLFGNAILLANDYCPLSYRSVDEAEYKKGMLLFYEKNNAWLFKNIFVEQFKFAVDNYFRV